MRKGEKREQPRVVVPFLFQVPTKKATQLGGIVVTLSGAFATLKEKPSQKIARIFPNPKIGVLRLSRLSSHEKSHPIGWHRGDLIGTRTRVCAVRGRRPNR